MKFSSYKFFVIKCVEVIIFNIMYYFFTVIKLYCFNIMVFWVIAVKK